MTQMSIKRAKEVLRIEGKQFALDIWGTEGNQSRHFSVKQVLGGEASGMQLAIGSIYPLAKSIPGVEKAKAWRITLGIISPEFEAIGSQLRERILNRILRNARESGKTALVADANSKKDASKWASLGFKNVAGTNFFVRKIRAVQVDKRG